MPKKFTLPKYSNSSKQNYVKPLLWAAVGLIFLVVVTPLLTPPKGGKDVHRKALPEKEKGMVVKEIPKVMVEDTARNDSAATAEGPASVEPRSAYAPTDQALPTEAPTTVDRAQPVKASAEEQKPAQPVEMNKAMTIGPETVPRAQEAQVASMPHASNQPAKEMAAPKPDDSLRKETGAAPAQAAQGSVASMPTAAKPKATPATTASVPLGSSLGSAAKPQTASTAPQTAKTGTSSTASVAAPPPSKAAASAKKPGNPPATDAKVAATAAAKIPTGSEAQKPDAQVKEIAGGKPLYTVQVGSYKDKQSAEEMCQSLQKKGYSVVMKANSGGKQGEGYVLQLKPVSDAGKANTLMVQMEQAANVKPTVVKVPSGK